VHSLGVIPDYPLHNAGNDAFATLLAAQLLLDPKNTKIPAMPRRARPAISRSHSLFGPAPVSPVAFLPGSTLGAPPVMPAAAESRAHSVSPRMLAVTAPWSRPSSRPHSVMFSQSAQGQSRASGLLAVPADEEGRLPSRQPSVSSTNALQAQMARTTIG
jgi:hypothetical protein